MAGECRPFFVWSTVSARDKPHQNPLAAKISAFDPFQTTLNSAFGIGTPFAISLFGRSIGFSDTPKFSQVLK